MAGISYLFIRKTNDRTTLKAYRISDCGRFMLFYKEAIHNAKKHADCSKVDISLNLSVEFNRGFSPAEMSPRKHRQTQINRGGIDGINHLVDVEPVAVFPMKSSCFTNQHLRECFVNTPVTMLVRICQIRSCDVASAKTNVEFAKVMETRTSAPCGGPR